MGSVAYDFLNQSLLFDETLIADAYQGISDRQVIGELESYRQHVLAHLPDFQAEAHDLTGRVAVLGNRRLSTIEELARRLSTSIRSCYRTRSSGVRLTSGRINKPLAR